LKQAREPKMEHFQRTDLVEDLDPEADRQLCLLAQAEEGNVQVCA
jgi:hypothetical protein